MKLPLQLGICSDIYPGLSGQIPQDISQLSLHMSFLHIYPEIRREINQCHQLYLPGGTAYSGPKVISSTGIYLGLQEISQPFYQGRNIQ